MSDGVGGAGAARRPGEGLLLAAGALALSALLLWPPADAARALEGACRQAAVWTPFVALAGLPSRRPPGRRSWPGWLGLALPVAGLAAALDRASGLPDSRAVAVGLAGVLLTAALGEVRHRAACGGLSAVAWAWTALVPLPPVLAATLAWGAGRSLTAEGLAGRLWRASPIGSMWSEVRPAPGAGAEGVTGALALPAVSLVLCLLALALWLEVRRGRGR